MNEEIASKFSDTLLVEKLPGGQGNSFRCGEFVLKPVDSGDIEKYSWMAGALHDIEFDSLRISLPVRSKSGYWIEGGFAATEFHEGNFKRGRLSEKLRAAERFHAATRSIPRPIEFSNWSSPWSRSAEVAWGEIDLPKKTLPGTRRILERILSECREIHLHSQFIHSDLAGNVLFNKSEPVIIDISPDFRPIEYANAMLVSDSIAWHDEPVSSFDLLNYSDLLKKQLVLRCVVFRLCVPVFFDPENHDSFESTLNQFRSVLNYIGVEI